MRTLASLLFMWVSLLATASPGPASSSYPKSDTDRISVDFPDEEIRTVLRNVADLYELNLLIPEELKGRTSVTLRDATWRQIFRRALYPIGYDFVEEENIICVVSLSTEPAPAFPFNGRGSASDLPWAVALAFRSLPYLTMMPLLLAHLILCGAVARDRLATKTRFAPKPFWLLLVLGGGFVPLLAYWLMHHSTLAAHPGRTSPV
jgi:hypothetical protein